MQQPNSTGYLALTRLLPNTSPSMQEAQPQAMPQATWLEALTKLPHNTSPSMQEAQPPVADK